jgi:hypothetical protein
VLAGTTRINGERPLLAGVLAGLGRVVREWRRNPLSGFLQVDAVDLVQRDAGSDVDLYETRRLGDSLEELNKICSDFDCERRFLSRT